MEITDSPQAASHNKKGAMIYVLIVIERRVIALRVSLLSCTLDKDGSNTPSIDVLIFVITTLGKVYALL